MFSFFQKPKLQITSVEKVQIERELCWLINAFGSHTYHNTPFYYPHDFGEQIRNFPESIQDYFEAICKCLELDTSRIRIRHSLMPVNTVSGLELLHTQDSIFSYSDDKSEIDSSLKTDLLIGSNVEISSLAAEMVRKLVTTKLIYSGYADIDNPDLEFSADVAVGFFGFGLFTANETVSCCESTTGLSTYFSIRKLGAINSFGLGYLLALIGWHKKAIEPKLDRALRPDAAFSYTKSIAYLESTNDSLLDNEHITRIDASTSLSTIDSILKSGSPSQIIWVLETIEGRNEVTSDVTQLKPPLLDLLSHRDTYVQQLALHILFYAESFEPEEIRKLQRIANGKDAWSSAVATNILSQHVSFNEVEGNFASLIERDDHAAAANAAQIANRIGKSGDKFSEDVCNRIRIALNRCDFHLGKWYALILMGISDQPQNQIKVYFSGDEELLRGSLELLNDAISVESEPSESPKQIESIFQVPAWLSI